MVTHERALAERYAQRLVFLADGKVVGDEILANAVAGSSVTSPSVTRSTMEGARS
jgi:ABC-type polar amino acid transport system ATPase subunit